MNRQRKSFALALLVFAAICLSPFANAQDNSAKNKDLSSTTETKGTTSGDYNVQQTIDFGYRMNEINGNIDTYDTFVNLGSGVRLFNYELDMRSIDHKGLLFDDLHFSNFGYGGDPNDVSRLSIDKNKWFDFSAMFRRDQNFWDYNLFANPLNP